MQVVRDLIPKISLFPLDYYSSSHHSIGDLVQVPFRNKNTLTKDVYLIEQITYSLKYYNVRLVKSNLIMKYKGVTHEYYDLMNPNINSDKLNSIYINDIGDGGKGPAIERSILASVYYHGKGARKNQLGIVSKLASRSTTAGKGRKGEYLKKLK